MIRPVESLVFGGFMLSLVIGITGIAMSLPIGIVLALGRQSNLLIVKSAVSIPDWAGWDFHQRGFIAQPVLCCAE